MPRLSCPSPEILLESISIPQEMGLWSFWKVKIHSLRCSPCQKNLSELRATWNAYFQPDPEIASSLVKVYSRLQRDETLILKGWKLGDLRGAQTSSFRLFLRTWGFPTGIAVSLGLLTVLVSPSWRQPEPLEGLAAVQNSSLPLSPIRVRDRNSVKVRYVQPELLHSMEFETVSGP